MVFLIAQTICRLVAFCEALYINSAEVVGRDTPRPPKRTGNENNSCSSSEISQPNTDGKNQLAGVSPVPGIKIDDLVIHVEDMSTHAVVI